MPQTGQWLLFLADRHAPQLPALLAAAQRRGVTLHGGIFPGLIVSAGYSDEGAIALPLAESAQVVCATLEDDDIDWHAPLPDPVSAGIHSALIFLDCLAPNVSRFLEEIYDQCSNTISYAGAGTGFHDLRRESSLIHDNRLVPHGGVVVLLKEDASTNVKHGWSRVAGPFIATRTTRNVIQELNWEPAGSFYRNEIAKLNPELRDKPVFPYLNSTYPLSINKQSSEDILRDPIDINDQDEIVLLSELSENSAMYIVEGDEQSLIRAAEQAITDCKTDRPVSVCFVSECYSRALKLKEALKKELGVVDEALRQFTSVRAEGVLALGEICGNRHSSLAFYNKTFVISLIHDTSE